MLQHVVWQKLTDVSEAITHRLDDGGNKHLKTSVDCYQTTRRFIPEGSHFHARRRENQMTSGLFTV
jgi:hypothetical protein